MSDPFEGRPFPRAVLIGAALLISFVIGLAAFVRMTGVGKSSFEPTEPVMMRSLRFEEQANGRTLVYDDEQNLVIAELHSGDDGFVHGVLRVLKFERNKIDAGFEAPYMVSLRSDGQVVLEDPQTGGQYPLRAFGPDNAGAFLELLNAAPLSAPQPNETDTTSE